MIEQIWFRIIIYLFCLLLAFLVGCTKPDPTTIDPKKQILTNENCEDGICGPPEGWEDDGNSR